MSMVTAMMMVVGDHEYDDDKMRMMMMMMVCDHEYGNDNDDSGG